MAIARGAGTEIIRCIHLEEVDATESVLIFGVQYHIYTVLSVICYAQAVQAAGNYITMYLTAYDAKEGTTGKDMYIFRNDMSVEQTYVWNDKFSFNGAEPTDFTGALNAADDQDAIADQAQNTAQVLNIKSENAADDFEIHCTYIDQNNA